MLQQERYDYIMNQLRTHSSVQVHDLSKQLKVSQSTIRRDINDLDQAGKLNKVFGGAVLPTVTYGSISTGEPDVSFKESQHMAEKINIAKYAASLINDNDFVFLDAGTTTGAMIPYITNKNATYVTNGIIHGLQLSARQLNAYVLAGQPKALTEAIVGTLAVKNLNQYDFTKAFIGANGIDLQRGFTTPDLEEAMVKTEAINHSYVSYILADSSKFDTSDAISFAVLEDCCILTDKAPGEKYTGRTLIKEIEQ